MGEGHSATTRRRGMSAVAAKRLAEKHATDTYLTPEQREAVQASERETQDMPVERTDIANEKGNLTRGEIGTKSKSRIPGFPRVNDVITHNHPNDLYRAQGSIAAMIGQSLSGQDISNLLYFGNKAVRAKTGHYVFSMENPTGKRLTRKEKADVKRYFTRYFNKLSRENAAYIGRGAEQSDRALTVINHKAAEATAKRYGLIYTRKPIRQ